jgi:hypothetical protein
VAVGPERAEHRLRQQEAGAQAADHGRLAQPARQGAERVRRAEQDEELDPEDEQVVLHGSPEDRPAGPATGGGAA